MFDKYHTSQGELDIDLNLGSLEFLWKEMGHVSQTTQVPGFDQSQSQTKTSFDFDWGYKPDSGKNDPDAVLVHVHEAKWDVFEEWVGSFW